MPRPGLTSRLLYRVCEAIVKSSPFLRMVFRMPGVTKCYRQAGSLCSFGAYILAFVLVWAAWILLSAYICIHLKGQVRAKGQGVYDSALGSLNRILSQAFAFGYAQQCHLQQLYWRQTFTESTCVQAAAWSLKKGQVKFKLCPQWTECSVVCIYRIFPKLKNI